MKIVFDLTSLYDHITGVERYGLEIAKSFINQFDDHLYVLIFKNDINKEIRPLTGRDNVRTIILKGKKKGWFNQVTLLSCLKKVKADAYLFLSFPQPILFFTKKTYTAVHDMTPWEMGDTMKPLSRLYYKLSYLQAFLFSKRIITVSKFSAGRIRHIAHVPSKKITIIRDGVRRRDMSGYDVIKAKYQLPDKYILTLSTIEPRKNLSLLIEAYVKLLEEEDVPDLVIAGRSGWLVENLLGAVSSKITDKIHFTGYIDEEDMGALYNHADFFVFPSKYEGFGIPPLEAMSFETPVLSSDAASLPEVLGRAADYFISDSVSSLKKHMSNMAKLSDDERSLMIKRGIKRASLYNWDKEAAKLERKLYEDYCN